MSGHSRTLWNARGSTQWPRKQEPTRYAEIEACVVKVTDGAARLVYETDEQWVPRSAIDATWETLKAAEGTGELVRLSIATWKLKNLRWRQP